MTRHTSSNVLFGLVVVLATGCGPGTPSGPTAAFLRRASISNFSISGNGTLLAAGDTSQLKATLNTPQGPAIVTDKVTWTSVDAGVATVSASGVVTAVAVGATSVKARLDEFELSLPIDVLAISGLSIGGLLTLSSINATNTLTLTATWPGGITRQVASTGTWSSLNPAIVSVSPGGLIRAIAFGSTTITATYQTRTATARVDVTPVVTVLNMAGNLSLTAVGQTTALSAIATFSDSSTRDVTNEATWKSSNTSVATVSPAGVATATGLGLSTITATFGARSAVRDLSVSPPGTFVISGRVRDPGQGQGANLGVPGFTVRNVTSGAVTTTDATGAYMLVGVSAGDRIHYEKGGWEPVDLVYAPSTFDPSPAAQRIVSITAGSTAAINTAPNDLIYDLGSGVTCSPCRLVRVNSSTGGTLHLRLTWTGSTSRLSLWIAGQTFTSNGTLPLQVVVDIPVAAGEVVIYAGLVGGQPFGTGYMTLTLATSIVPAPSTGAKPDSQPTRGARRQR